MIYQHIFNDGRSNYESFFLMFKKVVNYSEIEAAFYHRNSLEFIRAVALNCNKFGLPKIKSLNAIMHYIPQDFTIVEVYACISKVYNEYSADHASDVESLIEIINAKN